MNDSRMISTSRANERAVYEVHGNQWIGVGTSWPEGGKELPGSVRRRLRQRPL